MNQPGFKQSRKSAKDYFAWRQKRALPAVEKIEAVTSLKNKSILDIGCGFGALSKILLKKGAHVTAVEVSDKKIQKAKDFLGNNISKLKIKKVSGEKLPFKDESFDVIFLFDVIEHISHPAITIKECERLLKKGGILYVEFTPYYSPIGHHLYDFSKLPIHMLPKEKIKQIVFGKKIHGFLKPQDYWETFESLNKLKISKFQKLVRKFKKVQERYIIKYPEVFEINVPFLKFLGPFKDIFTLSYEGIYKK